MSLDGSPPLIWLTLFLSLRVDQRSAGGTSEGNLIFESPALLTPKLARIMWIVKATGAMTIYTDELAFQARHKAVPATMEQDQ